MGLWQMVHLVYANNLRDFIGRCFNEKSNNHTIKCCGRRLDIHRINVLFNQSCIMIR